MNQCIMEKNRSTEHSKGNKTVPGKVATTHTEDGHKQDGLLIPEDAAASSSGSQGLPIQTVSSLKIFNLSY